MSQVTQAEHSPVRYGSGVEFRALGPVEVLNSGERLEIGGKKQRAVLALLMANSGQPVSTDRLIEAAHGDDAPDGARRSVQTYVSNLRSHLGDMITSVASGYEFRPIDSFLDTVSGVWASISLRPDELVDTATATSGASRRPSAPPTASTPARRWRR